MIRNILCRAGLLLLACYPFVVSAKPSVAFYYGTQLPLEELAAFDWLVVEPRHITPSELAYLQEANVTVFAYVSIGEWNGKAEGPCKKHCRSLGYNQAWNSVVADQTDKAWRNYLVQQHIPSLIEQGYEHFFLDTLDSYLLFVDEEQGISAQRSAQIQTIQAITHNNPGVSLMLNRGFDLLPQLHNNVVAVVAESLFHRWDAAENEYSPQTSMGIDWLLAQLDVVHKRWQLPIVVVDYVDLKERNKAAKIARRITKQGFIPWVANRQLDEVGIGAISRCRKTKKPKVSPLLNTTSEIQGGDSE